MIGRYLNLTQLDELGVGSGMALLLHWKHGLPAPEAHVAEK